VQCDIVCFSALTLLVGRQEGIRPVKKLGVENLLFTKYGSGIQKKEA